MHICNGFWSFPFPIPQKLHHDYTSTREESAFGKGLQKPMQDTGHMDSQVVPLTSAPHPGIRNKLPTLWVILQWLLSFVKGDHNSISGSIFPSRICIKMRLYNLAQTASSNNNNNKNPLNLINENTSYYHGIFSFPTDHTFPESTFFKNIF